MHSLLQFLTVIAMFTSTTVNLSGGKGTTLRQVNDDKYKPGQVWSYKTRADEANSTLTILRIEEMPDKKRIVHIRVDGVQLTNCTGGPAPNKFEHMPFSKEAIDNSVVKMLRSGAVPDYQEGYSEWRAAWDAGKAGYYTFTVAHAVDASQAVFDQGMGCSK